MKIVYIGVKNYPAAHGGMETMTSAIVNELLKRGGFNITLYTVKKSINISNKNLIVCHVKSTSVPYLKTILNGLISVIKIKNNKPDIVHINGLDNAYLLPFFRMLKVKTVLNIRGTKWSTVLWKISPEHLVKYFFIIIGNLFFKINKNIFLRYADKIIIVNDYSIKEMPNNIKNRIEVVYNSLNIKKNKENVKYLLNQYDIKKNEYIVFVGRLVPLKGVHYLIKAFDRLGTRYPLIIIGDFNKKDYYHRYLRNLTDNSNIKYIGQQYDKDVYTFIENARMIVLPSETEGMAVTILESVLLKTPILASDIPENIHIWGDKIFYFHTKDSNHLSEMILKLLLNDKLRLSKVKSAFNHAKKKFDFDTQIDKLIYLYKQINKEIIN